MSTTEADIEGSLEYQREILAEEQLNQKPKPFWKKSFYCWDGTTDIVCGNCKVCVYLEWAESCDGYSYKRDKLIEDFLVFFDKHYQNNK